MNNRPVISNYDVGVFGTPEGPVYAYRRTYENDGAVNPVDPSVPHRTTDIWSVYRWDDESGEWSWTADCVSESVAASLAALLAGTPDPYEG